MNTTPMPVLYPRGGRHLLLHWWTYDERGHLALASSRPKLLSIAQHVIADDSRSAEFKAVMDIEIVAPSARICALAVMHERREEIRTFRHEVIWQMKDALKRGLTLPPPFKPCDTYVPDPESGSSGDDTYDLTHHCSCVHCDGDLVRLVEMTPESFYDRFHNAWKAAKPPQPQHTYREKHPRQPSRAPVPSDDEPLWYAIANFGHHAGGAELHQVDLSNAEDYSPNCIDGRVMFFFRQLRDLDDPLLDELREMAAAAKAADKAADEQHNKDGRAHFEQKERKRAEDAIEFFTRRA